MEARFWCSAGSGSLIMEIAGYDIGRVALWVGLVVLALYALGGSLLYAFQSWLVSGNTDRIDQVRSKHMHPECGTYFLIGTSRNPDNSTPSHTAGQGHAD